jgi:hypothetical protein
MKSFSLSLERKKRIFIIFPIIKMTNMPEQKRAINDWNKRCINCNVIQPAQNFADANSKCCGCINFEKEMDESNAEWVPQVYQELGQFPKPDEISFLDIDNMARIVADRLFVESYWYHKFSTIDRLEKLPLVSQGMFRYEYFIRLSEPGRFMNNYIHQIFLKFPSFSVKYLHVFLLSPEGKEFMQKICGYLSEKPRKFSGNVSVSYNEPWKETNYRPYFYYIQFVHCDFIF